MQITLKLYATLSKHLPAGSNEHAIQVEANDEATPHDIIEQFNVPQESAHLVMINGVYVHPNERDQAIFSDGDTLAVWPPVAGG